MRGHDGELIAAVEHSDEQRAELERIAFGRTHSREDEQAAAAARKQLADADRAATADEPAPTEWEMAEADSDVLAAAANDRSATWNDELPPPPPEPPRRGMRRIRAAWLVPIIAGALAVGYIGAPNVAVQSPVVPSASTPPSIAPGAAPSVTPSALPIPSGELTIAGPSSLKEADAWFETPPTERDGFGDPKLLQTLKIDPSAVRFVQVNAAGFQVWVAKTLDDDLCVLSTHGTDEISSACTPRAFFSRSGVTLAQSGYSIGWNGSRVTVSSPRLQLAG